MMDVKDKTVPRLIAQVAKNYPDAPAQYTKNSSGQFECLSYAQMWQKAVDFAGGLLSYNVKRGELLGLISEDRAEWQQADLGLLAIGAADVPRGTDASPSDLKYILSFTECRICIVETNACVKKILDLKADLPLLKYLVMFDAPTEETLALAKAADVVIHPFEEILEKGRAYNKENPSAFENEIAKGAWDDTAAIIFTSGTTGVPKGVTLSHGNFLTQLVEVTDRIKLHPGENALAILPVWHVYMREVEYVILSQGCAMAYSKPIGKILLEDMAKMNPVILPGVPRVFEAVMEGVDRKMRRTGGITLKLYNFFVRVAILHSRMHRKMFRQNFMPKQEVTPLWWILFLIPWTLLFPLKALGDAVIFKKIRAMLGKNFRAGIAGGGSYPKNVDEWFWALGVEVVEGYGLTETAPIVSVRHITRPVFGCIGEPLYGINARIVDMEGNDVGKGKKGVLQIKGGTVMKGYYKRPELTAKAIDSDGWLDTGDLAIIGVGGELKILGRVKDTIVLRGGENVEPVPLEVKLEESVYIQTAVVVGQDQRNLGALILPNKEELEIWAKQNNIAFESFEDLLANEEVYKFMDSIVRDIISAKNGFRAFERIPRFALLSKPFEVGRELSAKQELMRYKISELYAKELKAVFKE